MIFVTVGTQKFPFDRLLKKIDELAENGTIREQVMVQTGHSLYQPAHCIWSDFYPEESFYSLLQSSSLVITHGGIGTITKGLTLKKKVIIVPRLKKYAEHIDNHQLEIGEKFSQMGYALTCKHVNQLETYIEKAEHMEFQEFRFSYQNTASYLENYLKGLEEKGTYERRKTDKGFPDCSGL